MGKELGPNDLTQLELISGQPGHYHMQRVMLERGGWRMFQLDEGEQRRMQLIEASVNPHQRMFELHIGEISRITEIPQDMIDSFVMSDGHYEIVQVVPKLPQQERSDPTREHAIERGLISPDK